MTSSGEASDRDAVALGRDVAASQRDGAADDRDDFAKQREDSARLRDQSRRDRLLAAGVEARVAGSQQLRSSEHSRSGAFEQALVDRQVAETVAELAHAELLEVMEEARADRRRAAADRASSQRDRRAAAVDRAMAARDRDAAAADRSQAEIDAQLVRRPDLEE